EIFERYVFGFGFLINQYGVTLREGAARAVLTRDAHRRALDEQGPPGQGLGRGPVDALARLDHLAPVLELAEDLAVGVESIGNAGQRQPHLPRGPRRHRGLAATVPARCLFKSAPGPYQPIGLVRAISG